MQTLKTKDHFKFFQIIDKFLKDTNMNWNHEDWLRLVYEVKHAGYKITEDELGLLIERERSRIINKTKK